MHDGFAARKRLAPIRVRANIAHCDFIASASCAGLTYGAHDMMPLAQQPYAHSLSDETIGACKQNFHGRTYSSIFSGYLDRILNQLVRMPFSAQARLTS
ncbi:hypothetical protein MCEMIEM28_02207 [Burkholderiaceae bacterium]